MLTLQEIESRCAPVFERHPIVARAYVFGSYARGDQDESSDVDICYDRPDDPNGVLPTGLAFFGAQGELRQDLEEALGVPVDLLKTPDEASCAFQSQRRFAREVYRYKRGIYERT